MFKTRTLVAVLTAFVTLIAGTGTVWACGCLSPPVPSIDDSDFAVNQQSEQIIFEVDTVAGKVTAHVQIKFEGAPEQFAWLVPVPSEPDLALSEGVLFGLLDGLTKPVVNVNDNTLCPEAKYGCDYHESCPYFPNNNAFGSNNTTTGTANVTNNAGDNNGTNGSGDRSPVDVIRREQIGSYDTIIFAAADAQLTVDWLQNEGFIVNDTMTPYMQPYLDAGMLFVASKLITGAGVEEIRPLQMTYDATSPMIPLQLTAVAAEPNLTVTSYIMGGDYYEPVAHPLITIDETEISRDPTGRTNYPMVLSRMIDEAGGDAFIREYSGQIPLPDFLTDEFGCCGDEDVCGIGGNGTCECPQSGFESTDCEDQQDLVAASNMLIEMQSKHNRMTRLTTRLSAHEMTFDPGFAIAAVQNATGRLSILGTRDSLDNCASDVLDDAAFDAVSTQEYCSTTYCGDGQCVVTNGIAGCTCDAGFVVRQFTELDGVPSVTCIPDVNTVDLAAGGLELPDACKGRSCGDDGTCVDVGGFATCRCDSGYGGRALPNSAVPLCESISQIGVDSGARDYSGPFNTVSVCDPAPPQCGADGWLVEQSRSREGVACPASIPSPAAFVQPAPPICDFDDDGLIDSEDPDPATPNSNGTTGGCVTAGGSGSLFVLLLIGLLGLRRRKR